jgi:heterodisulfide reductase subunit C
MAILLVGLFAAFFWSANRRWQLLKVGRADNRLDRLGERLKGTYEFAFVQKRMDNYRVAGLAHKLIFIGFLVLLFRSLMLWGRGFDADFNLWVLGPEAVDLPLLGPVALGHIYEFLKDVTAVLVLLGALAFLYLRVVKVEARMSHSGEAILILAIIIVMMLADMLYDGASIVLFQRYAPTVCAGGQTELCQSISTIVAPFGAVPAEVSTSFAWQMYPNPAGSLFASALGGAGVEQLIFMAHAGFWTHASLVLIFLNLLPHSKHFHVITAIPNVFARDLSHPGKLEYIGGAEALGEKVMQAFEDPDNAEPIGTARIEDFSWKAILDFYTCTECGRCSDHCPAHRTGKILSPKQFTIDLRDHLYSREHEFLERAGGPEGATGDGDHHASNGKASDAHTKEAHAANGQDSDAHGADGHAADDHDGHHKPSYPDNPIPIPEVHSTPIDLVSEVIHPDVLWACTTCRACEEQCPVMISYVDKIVDMRRNLVMVKGEFPAELAMPFQGMEVNGNPWNLARIDRAAWSEGLEIPTMEAYPEAPVLYWVGCAASYDE